MKSPTKKQTILLNFVAEFTAKNNYSPSYREIMHALRLKSVSAVAEHIENCVAAGFLKKTPKSSRSLEVIEQKKYTETTALFRKKINELTEKDPNNLDILTLKEAAKLLGIPL